MKCGSPQSRLGLAVGGSRHLFASRPLVLLFAAIGLMWLYCLTVSSWGYHGNRQDSEVLREQVLDLSKKYVKSLASETGEVVDGPYSGRLTGYDLKKTLAVLLQDMMERLDRIEKHVFSSANNSGGDAPEHANRHRHAAVRRQVDRHSQASAQPPASIKIQQSPSAALNAAAAPEVDAGMLLGGLQENCDIPLESKFEYPECEAKVEWMMKHWRDDPCYARHGVDGTECSMKIFLSEVEEFCPVLPFRQHLLRQNETLAWSDRRQLADAAVRERARISLTEQLTTAPSLLARVDQRWLSMTDAANFAATSANSHWPERWPRRRILAHVGYLSASKQSQPPSDEAAQWADLLAGVGLLGHRLTVSVDSSGLLRQLQRLNYAKTECQGKRDAVLTHLVTDLVGILQVRSILGKSFSRFACLYRILSPFGVEPKFNDRAFASANELNTAVSGLDLSPMQYLSLFPFTLENFFLGSALPPPPPTSTSPADPSKLQAFVFGFGNSVWKDAVFYLDMLRPHFHRMHTAVDPALHPDVPAYVINHRQLNYTQYRRLLLSIVSGGGGGVVVGLGFPYEHPAPLEAVSCGLPFLNLRFKPPLDRTNSDYLRELPISRKLHSQDPYLESLGEPASFLIDLEARQQIPATLARAAAAAAFANVSRSVPADFSPAAYLARVRVLLSAPSMCREVPLDDLASSMAATRNSTPSPSVDVDSAAALAVAAAASAASSAGASPSSAVQFYLGMEGRSCSETCSSAASNSVCAPDQMRVINRRLELQERGIRCRRIRYDNSLIFPAISKPGYCHFLSHERLFSCNERQAGYSRLCPCRQIG